MVCPQKVSFELAIPIKSYPKNKTGDLCRKTHPPRVKIDYFGIEDLNRQPRPYCLRIGQPVEKINKMFRVSFLG